MDFDTKASILADILVTFGTVPEWTPFILYANTGLPFAWGHTHEYLTLNDKGRTAVLETWDMLVKALEISDAEYSDLQAMLDVAADKTVV